MERGCGDRLSLVGAQSGCTDTSGQGKRLNLVPSSSEMQSLYRGALVLLGGARSDLVRQRNPICVPSGDQAAVSTPASGRRWRGAAFGPSAARAPSLRRSLRSWLRPSSARVGPRSAAYGRRKALSGCVVGFVTSALREAQSPRRERLGAIAILTPDVGSKHLQGPAFCDQIHALA